MVRPFNNLVADYNSRCSSYRFAKSDKAQIERELTYKTEQLRADAARIANSWKGEQIASPPVVERPVTPQFQPQVPAPTPYQPNVPQRLLAVPDLTKQSEALFVQGRLAELGYYKGSPNGDWDTNARAALRQFRVAAGLADHAWDETLARRLLSDDAPKLNSPFASVPSNGTDPRFAPPLDAVLNPLNEDHLLRIQGRLREMGYYNVASSGAWADPSREALREFRERNGLPNIEGWDARTEEKLFGQGQIRSAATLEQNFERAFGGTWAKSASECPRVNPNSDLLPITISAERATAGPAVCNFQEIGLAGSKGRIRAQCTVEDQTWVANVTLIRTGNQLTWSSEKGTAKYWWCVP